MSTSASSEKHDKRATLFDKPRLILTHGEKGGVGKTTVARVIADYLTSRDITFKAFDAEGAMGQLLRFHPSETAPVDVADAAGIAPVLDYVMEGSGVRSRLVDLGARSGEDLKGWLYRGGALEEAEAGRLGITVVYVLGGRWTAWASQGMLQRAGPRRELCGGEELRRGREVRSLRSVEYTQGSAGGRRARNRIPATRRDGVPVGGPCRVFPFSSFAENQGGNFGFTERRYARTWLRECFAALEEVSSVLTMKKVGRSVQPKAALNRSRTLPLLTRADP